MWGRIITTIIINILLFTIDNLLFAIKSKIFFSKDGLTNYLSITTKLEEDLLFRYKCSQNVARMVKIFVIYNSICKMILCFRRWKIFWWEKNLPGRI